MANGLALTGEHGRELLDLPPGARVHARIVNGPAETAEQFRQRTRPQARRRTGAEPTSWYRIANHGADTGVAEIYLYDEIGYWGVSAQCLVDELKTITAPTIHLHINSPGGEVFDGFAIYTCLKAHPAFVHVFVDGLAASAASFIAQAGDKITTARNGMWMIHDAAGLCWGNASDMAQMGTLLSTLSDNIADIYAQRAGGTVDQWREAMRAETWYSGAEAVTAGLADEMTDPDTSAPVAPEGVPSNTWDLSIFRYAGRDAAPAPAARTEQLASGVVEGGRGTAAAGLPPAAPAADEDLGKPVATEPELLDDWSAAAAALVDEPTDPWAGLIAGLIDPAASDADDEFTRLREALT